MHLANFSSDKKVWPVYLILGNLLSGPRNSPTSMAVLLRALLPIPQKLSKSCKADQHQREINTDTLQEVFELIFAPLQYPAHDGVPIDCADGNVQRGFPILAVWIADYMENFPLY